MRRIATRGSGSRSPSPGPFPDFVFPFPFGKEHRTAFVLGFLFVPSAAFPRPRPFVSVRRARPRPIADPRERRRLAMRDVDAWIERLRRCEALEEKEVKVLCTRATEIFVEEGNVQRVDAPVTLCGDIHGQVRPHLSLPFLFRGMRRNREARANERRRKEDRDPWEGALGGIAELKEGTPF